VTIPADKDVPESTPLDLTLTISTPGAVITVGGVPDAMNYHSVMPKVTVAATGQDGDSPIDVTAKLTGVDVTYAAEAGESGESLAEDFSVKTLDLTIKGKQATPTDALSLALADLSGTLDLTGMPKDAEANLNDSLQSGLTIDLAMSYGAGAMSLNTSENGQPAKMTAKVLGGSLGMAMQAAGFHFDVHNKDLILDIAGTDETGKPLSIAGQFADIASTVDLAGQNWPRTEDFDAALKAGLKVAGGVGIGASTLNIRDNAGQNSIAINLAEASTAFALEAAQMHYASGAKGLTFKVASPDIPVGDVAFDLGELAFSFILPMQKSETPVPFSFVTKLIDIKLPDALWSMADPAGTLPHDPATLIIDTSGTATLTQDIGTKTVDQAAPPGLLHSLYVAQILFSGAGAKVTAKGGFTFDNSDTTTFDGMPLPTGKLDIAGEGVNGVINNLVTMGVLQTEQAMQARMAISMFSLNDIAKDTLTSVLEFKDKHFFANGAQLQ